MNRKSNAIICVLCGCAMTLALPLCANTYDASGETVLSNITETTRTVKTNGSGTLILSGTNSLYGLQMSAGTLRINGGLTTVTGPGGTSGTTATFAQAGGTTIIEGGAKLAVISTSSYSSVNVGGNLMVTNGTYEISGEFLNGFYVSSHGRLIVQDEGVFKSGTLRITQTGTASLTDDVGLFLNAGGKIYVKELFVDGTGRYGVIRYDGGTVYKTNGGDLYIGKAEAWDTVLSYVQEGGFYLADDTESNMNINRPLYSGTANDGGAHFSSNKGRWIYLQGTYNNSTFNGGTWLEGNVTLVSYLDDASFGAVPASPTNNIFFSGNTTFFGGSSNFTIHRNRNVWIDAGATATFGCNNSETGMRIGGEISVPDGEDAAKDTMFNAGNGNWGGFVVFDPGEGRTNRLDRLHVVRNLEIASGVTIVRSPSKGTETAAPLYVEGNDSAYTSGYNAYGNLRVSGGKLIIEGNRYFQANKYANVIVDGGTVSALTTYCEYLNGLSDKPATLTVEKGGVFEVYKMRVSQGGPVGSDVNINTGGVLRTAYFYMDNHSTGRINLNGGTIAVYSDSAVSTADKNTFLGGKKSDEVWSNVTVRVLAGGARFDTAGYSRRVNTPLLSAVGEGETDGGLTKLGEGTLTMTTTNTYNGATRLEGGTLTFAAENGRPDGDIEFAAAALAACTDASTPLLWGVNIGSFRSGCGLRVAECETLDAQNWEGRWHTVARFNTAIPAMPSVTFVKSDGTVVSTENGWNGWTFRISADGQNLEFKRLNGTVMSVR